MSISWSGYETDTDGEPSRLLIVNDVPFPDGESVELWFLKVHPDGGWAVTDIDDGRYWLTDGDSLSAMASTAGPAARDVERAGLNGLIEVAGG